MVFVEDLIVCCDGDTVTDVDDEIVADLFLNEESCYFLANVSHNRTCNDLITASDLHGHAHLNLCITPGIDDDETAL